MAKFGRYDPRNKKKNRNKQRSMEKDFRIERPAQKLKKARKWEDVVDNEYQYSKGEI